MSKPILALAALVLFALPAAARAGNVSMRVQDVPLGTRALAAAPVTRPFNMLAVHWRGSGAVSVRTHALHGHWSAWVTADADVEPDGGTGPWHDGDLVWTGAADRVQFRTEGRVVALRSYELWSRVGTAPTVRRPAEASMPAIVSRAGWGANEEIVRAKPLVAPVLKLAVVHHTAGTNTYTRAQAPAIVRGIEVYHVEGNGWNDIGYNFLVDRFGTVYEGRGGGIERNVIGAHAEGFNTGSVGVALIGNYSVATPPAAQQAALVQLLSWRLDLAHIDPLSTVVYTSGGNYKFHAGKVVTLRAISGHRDTGPSECPGNGAYALLPSIAKRVSLTGLPKLYTPTVAGVLGGPVRFQARLSSSLPWTVTVTGALGVVVAKGSGTGSLVDWTWQSAAASKGLYTWTIAAPGVLVAKGTLGVGTPAPPPAAPVLSLTNLAASPSEIAPSADGTGAGSTISFALGAPAEVTAVVLDSAGATVATILAEHRLAGFNTFAWAGGTLPDGRYTIAVTANAGTKSVTKAVPVVVDRTLADLSASLPVISPNGDGVNDAVAYTFTLSQQVPVRLDIEQAGAVVATPFQGTLAAGAETIGWDGTSAGARLPDGQYTAVITFTDALGDVPIGLPLQIDTTPPVLTLVSAQKLQFSLSEQATLLLTVNGTTKLTLQEPKGTFTVPTSVAVTSVSAQAQDAGGNLSTVVSG